MVVRVVYIRNKYTTVSVLLSGNVVDQIDVVEKDNVAGHSSVFYTLLYKHDEYLYM